MSTTQKFTPKTVYQDHQLYTDIMDGRNKQNNIKTPGSKCNRCAYDIAWDMDRSIQLWGKRIPFELGFDIQHVCDIDDQGHYIIRKGYGIVDGKAVYIAAGQQQFPPAIKNNSNRIPSPPLQGVSSGPDIYSIEAMVKEQISQISQHYMAFQEEYKKIVQAQSQEIATLRGIVSEYITHNPTEGALKMIISEMIKYLPEPALAPKIASDLKETSSGYTRGENQN